MAAFSRVISCIFAGDVDHWWSSEVGLAGQEDLVFPALEDSFPTAFVRSFR